MSSKSRWIYDVFLSFGEDTRLNFTSRLYDAVADAGFSVYMGVDEELRRGDRISSQLEAIEASRISVIIFSKKYANSRWCLQELERIMECRESIGQSVIPVFYEVEPSDVRNQRGEFGEAFEYTVGRIPDDKVNVWRALLKEAAISMVDLHKCRNEFKNVNRIVENINCLLNKRVLPIPLHPVGVDSRVQDLISMLSIHSQDVIQVGILGMGGIGKTSIAKIVYNQIHRDYDACCFLPNVRKCWEGGVNLQEQLLSDICGQLKRTIYDIEEGKMILRLTLSRRRILVVLDDVSQSRQLEALCGSPDWFGSGSRIIITTRDKHLLLKFEVHRVYEMMLMNFEECVELFSWHAFKQAYPKEGFEQLSARIVDYCGGVPLVLEVIGSVLFDKDEMEWQSVLAKIKMKPVGHILSTLKASFDSLNDIEKKIFLEIAGFFIGMDRSDVIQILNGYRFPAELGIRALVDRRLVTVDNNNILGMHDLLEDTGREIIRQSRMEHEPKIYDVFLSFRGKDTRAIFTSHLYASLRNAGIYVFKDDDEIQRGDTVSFALLEAIKKSRIHIVVISKNYANSRWCMQELERIIERRSLNLEDSMVVPVFYGVDPSDVRHQTGMFGKGFEDLLKRMAINQVKQQYWRQMLLEVGGISGFVILESRNENEEIMKIVEHISSLLDWNDLFTANHPVGVDSRVEGVLKLLENSQSEDPLILGIWGMGGQGKTTIAKAFYNKIRRLHKFEGRCFLLDIRQVWEQDNGGVRLQEQLLSNIYKTMKLKIDNIESGKLTLEKRLKQKRIILVLDDIDKLEQLNALAGSREWFGPGSIIIITTRDDHLLRLMSIDKLYKMEEMKHTECIELFSWHAFKQSYPPEEFVDLSSQVVSYCGRLPLALEVLGSHLFERDKKGWESVLKKLKTIGSIPNEQVHQKLRISFEGLIDEYQKVFLDIAFFFIGMERNDVVDILNGCDGYYSPDNGITVLMQRSLVTVDAKSKIRMHDLLQVMAREIVCDKPSKAPENRSRLWRHDEVHDVLSKCLGTITIEGLTLKFPTKLKNPTTLKTKAFKHMKRLRLLQLSGVKLDGNFKYLSTDLRWLCWHGFPSTYAPENFDQEKLVSIDLQYYSNPNLGWNKDQELNCLKILNLSHSQNLSETPDFSNIPNLEKLIIKDCPKLSSISHTIGQLKKILLINLKGCTSLSVLPRSIYKLKSLKTLILSGCSNIDKLEEDLEQMESLTNLMADKTAITQVPHSIIRLKSIAYIALCGFEGLSRNVFPSIIWSWTSPTNNLSPQMQTYAADLSFPVGVTDVPNSFHGMSSINKMLSNAQSIRLECDSQFQTTELKAMETASHVSNWDTSALVDYCSQGDFSGSQNSLLIQMGMSCPVIRETILQKLTTNYSRGDCLVPCDENPEWLSFNGEGSYVIFEVPKVNGRKMKTMMLCILYSSSDMLTSSEGLILKNVLIINHTKVTTHVYEGDALASLKDQDWQSVISNLEAGDRVQVVVVVLGYGFTVNKTIVYLIYDEPTDQNMEQLQEDLVVSGGNDMAIDDNFNVSGGDGVVANESLTSSCGDNLVSITKDNDSGADADTEYASDGDDMTAAKKENNFSVDVGADMNSTVSGGEEMEADKIQKVCDDDNVGGKNSIAYGAADVAPAENGNATLSGTNENRLRRFFKLPSLVRAILMIRVPLWFSSLLMILVWVTCSRLDKLRMFNLFPRHTIRWKWLVECINKLIANKKANKAQGAIESSGRLP